jgi:hypothetical protein
MAEQIRMMTDFLVNRHCCGMIVVALKPQAMEGEKGR